MKRLLSLVLIGILAAPLATLGQAPQQSLEQRVQVLERRVRALSDLVLRMDRLQQEVQQLRGEIEVQNHAVETMKKRQRDLYLDIDRRLSQMAAPGAAAPPAQTPPAAGRQPAPVEAPVVGGAPAAAGPTVQSTTAKPDEERKYQQAFDLLTQRRYAEARKAFQSFLARYPAGQYADNAQYWLGEASYVTRDFDIALADFSALLARFPESPKVPGAMLKIGYIEFEKQQFDKSRQTLEKLIKRYPGTSETHLAQEFIRKKGL